MWKHDETGVEDDDVGSASDECTSWEGEDRGEDVVGNDDGDGGSADDRGDEDTAPSALRPQVLPPCPSREPNVFDACDEVVADSTEDEDEPDGENDP